jgi:putative tryptophan/tyrosine transport system substrate-binding protein
MAIHIGRRYCITLLGGAAAAWPLAARAQQPERMRRIVFLHSLAENDPEVQVRIAAFRQGLETLGWTENRNVQIEHRFSRGDLARIQAYTAEVVSSAPDLIVATSTPVTAALKQATHTIPIVFSVVNDPVGQSSTPRDLWFSAVRNGRRADLLWTQHRRYCPALGCVCRSHSQGRKAG